LVEDICRRTANDPKASRFVRTGLRNWGVRQDSNPRGRTAAEPKLSRFVCTDVN
jgi:hypothetical protein